MQVERALLTGTPGSRPGRSFTAAEIDHAAIEALRVELSLHPKPGLVTPTSRGSHTDMDHHTLAAGIAALQGYFGDCVMLGRRNASLRALQKRGLAAEAEMFCATGGVNTHKGAIFSLGLLSAACGLQSLPAGRTHAGCIASIVSARWGKALHADIRRIRAASFASTHGERVLLRDNIPGAREHAAAGFPILHSVTLPALRTGLRCGTPRRALLHALVATIAVLPDTNIIHRGGVQSLRWVHSTAHAFISNGGVFANAWEARLQSMCDGFVARGLSPGGSADLLACAWFMHRLERP